MEKSINMTTENCKDIPMELENVNKQSNEQETVNMAFRQILKNAKTLTPDPALIAYYERGRRQNKKHRSFRFTKSGCQKQYMRPNLFGISQEFQGFISQTPAMSAICEMNKFMVDFRRNECNIGKFAFGVPRFIHGTLQEIPFWLVGEILDEDEWTFIIGSGEDGKNGRAFDKDASIYSYFKIMDSMEELETMVEIFEDYLEEIWKKLQYCEPYSDLGFQIYLEKNSPQDFIAKHFSAEPMTVIIQR